MPTATTDNRRHEAPGNPELHMTRSDDPVAYVVKAELAATRKANRAAEDETIAQAIAHLLGRLKEPGTVIDSPDVAKRYFFLQLAEEPAECFCVLFLDNRHQAIAMDRLFNGTIDGASVHPREVVRACIHHNAAAVMLCHNHPSGVAEPSQADIKLTKRLIESLALIDVRILDHLIIGNHPDCTSFAERGLI